MEQPALFSTQHKIRSCNHLFEKTDLSANVFCSSWRAASKAEDRPIPKFGLYADPVWKTKSRNEFINWPDFNAPSHPKLAFYQIASAYQLALKANVEIGCIGGHGRTGTILACMAILDKDLDPDQAIDFTRSTYCNLAIETSSQESYIDLFWRMRHEL